MSLPFVRPRRLLAAAAVASLTLAGLALTAPPASAAPWTGQLGKGTSYDYGNAGCAESSSGTPATGVAMPANTAVTLNVADSATGTGPTAGDTATMSASVTGSAQINETPAGVTSFDISAEMKANAARALGAGSACSATSTAAVTVIGTFSTTTAGLLDLDFSNLGTGFTQHQMQIYRIGPGLPSGAISISVGENGRQHKLVSVQPGDYQFQVGLQAYAFSSSTPTMPSSNASVKVNLHGEFKPGGVADGAQEGSGSPYLVLGNAVSCAPHSLTADFTDKAGKKVKKPKKGHKAKKPVIKKATFFVNGTQVSSVKKPNKNTLVTLTGVPDDLVTVTAQLKLTGKGTVTVQRSYLPCT